jgi:murein DD-endopeptidase MepM/ murein hydrolase activator NlpD
MKGDYDFEVHAMPRPQCRIRTTLIVLIAAVLVFMSCDSEVPTIPDANQTPCMNRAHFGATENSPYVLPYPVGSAYSVLQSYCNPRGSHREQLAYDFLLPIGDPVVAARKGEVMDVVDRWPDDDHQSDHFNRVYIRHDDGTVAFYAHMQLGSITVAVGDHVQQGQQFALSGSSGTPIADLHFGVYDSWPVRHEHDLAINFRNAEGPLDERGGLIEGEIYLALQY